ncbi:MAG TPA: T9SS type A sorting domain-containing protein [Chitinophagaceae bacterium]|nr:T9SS type A sorting domain-containing protein [Chitinophagaceae bacterium]
MNSNWRTLCLRFLVSGSIILSTLTGTAQAPTHTPKFSPVIDNNINGYWEYLPRNYAADVTTFYPLLIYLHGAGEQGDQPVPGHLNRLLRSGVPKLINEGGFPDSFFVMNRWHKFIVLSPQIKNGISGNTSIIAPSTIENLIQFAVSNYRVDQSRIYLSGLSMGGGGVWDYAGSSIAAAKKLAGIIVACGAGDLSAQEANNIAEADLPVLATHNNDDNIIMVGRTQTNIANIMAYTPVISPQPKAVYWQTGGHNAWTRTFEDIVPGTSAGGNLADTLGMSAYAWALQFVRASGAALPVNWKHFSVRAQNGKALLQWEVSTQVNVKEYVVEKSADGVQWTYAGTVTPSGASLYQFFDQSTTAGTTYYRIRQVDMDGRFTYSGIRPFNTDRAVTPVIYPNPFISEIRIDAGSGDAEVFVRFTSNTGRLVLARKQAAANGQIVIKDLSHLAAGYYYVTVEDMQGRVLCTAPLVKR